MMEGRVIHGRYRLLSKLGQGGMGSVWRATHVELGTPVAIKLIDPTVADSKVALSRFKREAQAAASLRGTNVVQILDYGVDDAIPYIAMELLEGESLGARLSRKAPLTPKETVDILGHVAKALARAHAQSIVHRDLKPDNIFIVRDGDEEVTKVLDFGIAKTMSALAFEASIQTKSGAILGTPHYMSPEQAAGRGTVDHRADIWSFGVIAFECLTGCRPFNGSTLGGLVIAICTEPIPLPSQVANVPRGFDNWFSRCVCRDQADRFQSIVEAMAALRAICEPSSLRSVAEPQWEEGAREATLQNNSLRAPSLRTPSAALGTGGDRGAATRSAEGGTPETVSASARTLGTSQKKRSPVAYIALALLVFGGGAAGAIGYARHSEASAAASAAPSETTALVTPSSVVAAPSSVAPIPEPSMAVTAPLVIEGDTPKSGAVAAPIAAPITAVRKPQEAATVAAVIPSAVASATEAAPVAAPTAVSTPHVVEPATRPEPVPTEVPPPPRRRNVEDRLAF